MPKKHRLSNSDFRLIANARFRRERGKYFALSYGTIPGAKAVCPRIACVVSKKVAARAIERNLIKRRCRDVARSFIADIEEPLALVFYAGRNARGASFSDTKQDISELFHKLAKR